MRRWTVQSLSVPRSQLDNETGLCANNVDCQNWRKMLFYSWKLKTRCLYSLLPLSTTTVMYIYHFVLLFDKLSPYRSLFPVYLTYLFILLSTVQNTEQLKTNFVQSAFLKSSCFQHSFPSEGIHIYSWTNDIPLYWLKIFRKKMQMCINTKLFIIKVMRRLFKITIVQKGKQFYFCLRDSNLKFNKTATITLIRQNIKVWQNLILTTECFKN